MLVCGQYIYVYISFKLIEPSTGMLGVSIYSVSTNFILDRGTVPTVIYYHFVTRTTLKLGS